MDAKKFKTSIKAKILLGFGSAIVILLTSGIISYQSFNDLMRSLDFLSRPDAKLVKLNDVLSDLSLSESHIRSYFISSEKRYLDKYRLYSGKLENNIDSLAQLIKESQADSGKVQRVLDLWHEKKQHTQDLIELHEKKREQKLPDNILAQLNKAHPDIPTIIITKTTTIKRVDDTPQLIVVQKEVPEEKRSLLKRIFSGKEKEALSVDTIFPSLRLVQKTETVIDTIYTVGQANEVKEEAFNRILARIRRQNDKSRQMLQDNETEIIHKDIGLVEFIRNIVMDLKVKEEKVTQANVEKAKQIVEGSLIRIFLFGIFGISGILIFGFMTMNDIARSNYHKNQLLAEKTQAEELVKTKENFLATMSHEIRTPLNSIVGFTEQLSQTNLQSRQKYYLQAVSNSTAHLLSLVNDILDLSRIEAGKIDLENTVFNVRDIIEEVYNAFYLKAEEKQLALTWAVTGENQLVTGDPFRLKQILFNLVSNAIKFTHDGKVSITCENRAISEEEASVCITVTDTGIGIPAGKIEHIFDSFSQADSSISRKFGGTGLGLAISRKLVELQKGDIYVHSKEGEGSEFQILLTYKRSNSSLPLLKSRDMLNVNLLHGLRILVVEDDEFNLLLFHTILIKWNMKVTMVSSGEEAMQTLTQENFDLVITDIHMPGISGVELCRRLKSHGNTSISGLPVLAVTANVIKESAEIFRDSGFAGILLKPFKEEQLGKAILIALNMEGKGEDLPLMSADKEDAPMNLLDDFIKFSGGDMKIVYELTEAFIANSSQQLQALESFCMEKDWHMLKETAHKLIPGFGHLHNYEVSNLLEEMERYLDKVRKPDEIKLEKMTAEIISKGYAQLRILEEEKARMT